MAWKRATRPSGWFPKRGEVCLFSLDKERPALVVSSDALNRYALDVCVAPISSVEHRTFTMRPKLSLGEAGLARDSWAKCDQVTTVEKKYAVYPPLGAVSLDTLRRVERAIKEALELF